MGNSICLRGTLLFTLLLGSGVAQGAVTTVTIFSPANNRNLSFHVYTPPGYNSNIAERYPTVFSFHGIGGSSQNRANTYFPTLDARMVAGEIVPMIWVFVDGQTDSFYGDAYDGHKQVYSHFIDEILPYVDAQYRTIAEREQRALEGFSMGGYGALLYAAKHPELFSAVVEYGGPLMTWQNLTMSHPDIAEAMYDTIEANWLPYSLWDVTASNAAAIIASVNYKMIVGDADPLYQSNIRFRDHVLELGIDPQFQVVAGVSHAGGQYLTEGSGVRFLSEHFAAERDVPGDYNSNDVVDAADFTTWRDNVGTTTVLPNDPTGGTIGTAQYNTWRTNFGQSGNMNALVAAESVPEPAGIVLLVACLLQFRLQISATDS